MRINHFLNRLAALFVLASVSITLSAQEEKGDREFVPRSGQAGKDVIWVPTPQMLVDKMLDIAKVTADDFVIDLGSGDGRTVITAAKRGASALGIEYNPDMVELSKKNAASEGVSGRAQFMQADLFEADFSKATVITMFLLPSINVRLRPKLLDLKPGTRIVSNTFDMEDWTPDETATLLKDCNSWCDALMWIIPAKVEGTWKMPQGELNLTQTFQMLSGTLKAANNSVPVIDGKLTGAQITFSAGGAIYTGTVNGNVIEGSVTSGQQST
ncbi:MAG TPA: class I SAM-dependent methyltransferase, partial [Bacteroidales bacterium]|nr:class I SAM-dependent methyltransferase [Bacteroidales bacterium]